jgi:alcohol dehydrogenase class IV
VFEFATARRIIFGAGELAKFQIRGDNPFFVTGSRAERSSFRVVSEPTVDLIRDGVEQFRAGHYDTVVAIGGGSVIDAGKAIAAAAANPGDLMDYLEVVGRGQPLERAPLPFIAVPTTAGTGAEVTRNAVLGVPEQGVKVSLRSPLMLPDIAIVDPELMLSMPPNVTATTGMDAITQLIEPYVSLRANPITDALCLEGLRLASTALSAAFADGNNLEARTAMAQASLLGGLALANAGLGVVHGFAAAIGGMFAAPHGAICALLLGPGMAANIAAGAVPDRYKQVARILTGDAFADASDGVVWVRTLVSKLEIPPLQTWGLEMKDAQLIARKASASSSMRANPVPLSITQLQALLDREL